MFAVVFAVLHGARGFKLTPFVALAPLIIAVLLAQAPEPAFRLRAVGDVMLGTAVPEGHLPPNDGNDMLFDVRAALGDADVTFVNLEGPLCDSGRSSKCRKGGSCYAFRSPTRYVQHLADAGVDVASTANNHSGDFGEACRRETERTLDSAGIAWSGPPGSIALLSRAGKKVALVAFHTSASCNDVNDLPAAKALVAQARGQAELVVVSFHGGAEGLGKARVVHGAERYLGENRGDLRKFARGVIDAGADLVIGHGPHLLRGLEVYKGHLIAYSLGNFATYGRFSLGGALGLGAILEVSLGEKGQFVSGRILSTKQVGQGVPKLDESGAGAQAMRTLSALDFPDTSPRIGLDGTLAPR